MTHPLVSILIPCYNAELYVGEAIQSALAQDYGRVEVVVVDDGSIDGSLKAIRSFFGDPRFRYETGPHRGGNAARNQLLRRARGEFVQFLDADDLLCRNKVAAALSACLQRNREEGADLRRRCEAAYRQGLSFESILSIYREIYASEQ